MEKPALVPNVTPLWELTGKSSSPHILDKIGYQCPKELKMLIASIVIYEYL
jgi:hypothetical protein